MYTLEFANLKFIFDYIDDIYPIITKLTEGQTEELEFKITKVDNTLKQ